METVKSNAGRLKAGAAGWIAGLCIISLFVFSVKAPPAHWGAYWQIRPLLLTPLIAGMGAMAAYFIWQKAAGGAGQKILFTVLAAGAFLFSLWIGIVLGLDGTLWN